MNESDQVFAGSIPELYDTYLVLPRGPSAVSRTHSARIPRFRSDSGRTGQGRLLRSLDCHAGENQLRLVTTPPGRRMLSGHARRNEIEPRDASLLGHVTEQATEAIAARFGDGPVTGKIKGYIVTARR